MKNSPSIQPDHQGAISPQELSAAAKTIAKKHGFNLAGIAAPVLGAAYDGYRDWIEKGYAGEMGYLYKDLGIRRDLRLLWPDAKSVLVVAMQYLPQDPPPEKNSSSDPFGEISRYAHGGDYHKFIKKRLLRVLRELQTLDPGIEGKSFVDTGPILERDLATACGLGWKGKNSLLLHRELGSYFFLGTLLLNRALPPDPAFDEEHCGTCTHCIDACPTGAIVAPGVVDARLCISYLTIELRGPIPRELRDLMGHHVFGCDICQEVCPWNEGAPYATESRFLPRPGAQNPSLLALVDLTEEDFNKQFQGTPIMRSKYGGFLRNVIVAIGNTGGGESLEPLAGALGHREPLARGHAAWAIAKIAQRTGAHWVRFTLEGRLSSERNAWVREEIELSLGMISNSLTQHAENHDHLRILD